MSWLDNYIIRPGYTTLKMHLSRRVACHAIIFSHSIGYVPRRKTIFFVFLKCRKLLDHGCFCRCERDVLRLSRASHSTGQYRCILNLTHVRISVLTCFPLTIFVRNEDFTQSDCTVRYSTVPYVCYCAVETYTLAN